MKQLLRTIFSPILNIFESGSGEFVYKSSHRYILIFIGCMFSLMAIAVLWVAQGQDPGYFFPVLIFGLISIVSFIIGFLGTDRAVAKIWGTR